MSRSSARRIACGAPVTPVVTGDVNPAAFGDLIRHLGAIERWRSPVLLIHGDDDRNVPFGQSVDLAQALRHLVTEVGASQIVMGTDYPFPWTKTSVDHILNTPGLSDADRAGMLGDTAAKLLGTNLRLPCAAGLAAVTANCLGVGVAAGRRRSVARGSGVSAATRSTISAGTTSSGVDVSASVERLRSNFINGIKHLPVSFTPTARRKESASGAALEAPAPAPAPHWTPGKSRR